MAKLQLGKAKARAKEKTGIGVVLKTRIIGLQITFRWNSKKVESDFLTGEFFSKERYCYYR